MLMCCSVCALAQNEQATAPAGPKYRLRAGEAVQVAAPRETLDFFRGARSRVARAGGISEEGFVLGTNAKGDRVVLAASLSMKPGEYTVSLSAVSETGEERVMTVDLTLDPPQAEIVSTQALIAQGWVVPGAFEQIAAVAWKPEVESQFVLGDNYDSLDKAAGADRLNAR